ncbi:hypothetical protein GALMADRAFT_925197 [Galerina marginata CBS 339.88]|uniref:Uncharacterized protein n=1 Tax=Galerina marginata (strain CBS 339.88) TaxID=685588 RepID=A0A067SND5_GALM3|nr:hypothetical protein GALMADRAFT_925197 [Galerina marginata CBS 339.88]
MKSMSIADSCHLCTPVRSSEVLKLILIRAQGGLVFSRIYKGVRRTASDIDKKIFPDLFKFESNRDNISQFFYSDHLEVLCGHRRSRHRLALRATTSREESRINEFLRCQLVPLLQNILWFGQLSSLAKRMPSLMSAGTLRKKFSLLLTSAHLRVKTPL